MLTTFSQEVKREILTSKWSNDELRDLLTSFLVMSGKHRNGKVVVKFREEFNRDKIIDLYELVFNYDLRKYLNNKKFLFLDLEDTNINLSSSLMLKDSFSELNNPKAILAGIFLARGYINSPESKYYHFEMRIINEENLKFLKNIFSLLKISFKEMKKDDFFYIYVKKASIISDIQKMIRATQNMFKFENIREERNFASNYKKLVAIETYNAKKTSDSSVIQCSILKEKIKLKNFRNKFTENEVNISLLRLKNPYSSLQKLTTDFNEKYKTKYCKSSINKWLNNVIKEGT